MKIPKDVDAGLYTNAVLDLMGLLLQYGFTPEEAMRVSTDFWRKHKKKLRSVI